MDSFDKDNYEKEELLKAEFDLLEILAEAEEDVRTGRVSDVSETFSKARDKLC